jgi:hypothetical protein
VAFDVSQQWRQLRDVSLCLTSSLPAAFHFYLWVRSFMICKGMKDSKKLIGLAGNRRWCYLGATGWACSLASCRPSSAIFTAFRSRRCLDSRSLQRP